MQVTLRKVAAKDIQTVYLWRNHPRVRKWMFVSEKIGWNEHRRFWKRRLRQRNRYSYIVQANGQACGVVRLDPDRRNEKAYAIDIYIDPGFQGKGIGQAVIAAVKRIAHARKMAVLVATVKPTNTRSQQIFERNGFGLRHYEYVYQV